MSLSFGSFAFCVVKTNSKGNALALGVEQRTSEAVTLSGALVIQKEAARRRVQWRIRFSFDDWSDYLSALNGGSDTLNDVPTPDGSATDYTNMTMLGPSGVPDGYLGSNEVDVDVVFVEVA